LPSDIYRKPLRLLPGFGKQEGFININLRLGLFPLLLRLLSLGVSTCTLTISFGSLFKAIIIFLSWEKRDIHNNRLLYIRFGSQVAMLGKIP
jgi:hypothetical protein